MSLPCACARWNAFFTAPRDGGPMVLVAGGTGISSLNAVVDHVRSIDPNLPLHLYWGVRHRAELYLHEHFANLGPNLRFTPVIESETGHSVIDAVLADIGGGALDPECAHVHLSGPRGMVAAAVPLLLDAGLDRGRIYCDDDATLNLVLKDRKPA